MREDAPSHRDFLIYFQKYNYVISLRDFVHFWNFLFFYKLFIVGTEINDVEPELSVKIEKDDMSCTSYHEGRYLKMSPKQEAVTRGRCFTKIVFNRF